MSWHKFPEGYRPLNYCRECGKDFSAEYIFDSHRVGVHDYTYSEGLRFNPPVEDGRRCMTEEEMIESGLRPMTEDEMASTKKQKHRIRFNVEMWFDPAEKERGMNALKKSQGRG